MDWAYEESARQSGDQICGHMIRNIPRIVSVVESLELENIDSDRFTCCECLHALPYEGMDIHCQSLQHCCFYHGSPVETLCWKCHQRADLLKILEYDDQLLLQSSPNVQSESLPFQLNSQSIHGHNTQNTCGHPCQSTNRIVIHSEHAEEEVDDGVMDENRQSMSEEGESDSSSDSDDQRLQSMIHHQKPFHDEPSITFSELVCGLKEGRFRRIVCLTGAGVSCASGIPDFRSPNGLYSTLTNHRMPHLSDPSIVFDLHLFFQYPVPFWIISQAIFYDSSSEYHPTLVHFFLSLLARKQMLQRLYTQNIDGLDRKAGVPVELLVEGHGTSEAAHCTHCRQEFSISKIKELLDHRTVPICNMCSELIKPDIVFFHEGLPKLFYDRITTDQPVADLFIVIGTSLQVAPMNMLPFLFPPGVPRILLNNELVGSVFKKPGRNHLSLIDDCQQSVLRLVHLCGWDDEFFSMMDEYKQAHQITQFPWESILLVPTIPVLETEQFYKAKESDKLKQRERQYIYEHHSSSEESMVLRESDSSSESSNGRHGYSSSPSQSENMDSCSSCSCSSDDSRSLEDTSTPINDCNMGSIVDSTEGAVECSNMSNDDSSITENDRDISSGSDLDEESDHQSLGERLASNFFVNISDEYLKNEVDEKDDSSEHVVISSNGQSLELNGTNSRAYKEMIKWKFEWPDEKCEDV